MAVMTSLKYVVHVLHALSTSITLGDGIGLVRRTAFLCIPSFLCSFHGHFLRQYQSSWPLASYSRRVCPWSHSYILLTSCIHAIKGIRSSYDAFIDLVETIEHWVDSRSMSDQPTRWRCEDHRENNGGIAFYHRPWNETYKAESAR